MKLIKVQAKNFRSIENSNVFDISNLTCLVGKNEAGKTALLHALYGLKPFREYSYDKIRDYPRRYLSRYDERNPSGESEVISTWWELSDEELESVEEKYGEGVLNSKVLEVRSGIDYEKTLWTLDVDEAASIKYLFVKHKLGTNEKSSLKGIEKTKKLSETLTALEEKTENQQALLGELASFRDNRVLLAILDFLSPKLPNFFYTSHFERMSGEISLQKLALDKQQNDIDPGDQIFLDFLEYAGTSVEELQNASRYEELKAQCEGASNDITDEIFEFWSQNEALSVKIELGEGKPDDPAPYNSGTIAKIRIDNLNHRVSVPLSERSAGFVWFFSFLSQFKQLKKVAGNTIILLDEPGLTLHGKAQSDLLRYIVERLLPNHQVIYSTHSPFMVPAERLADVRVVEDVIEWDERRRPIVHGTKVSSDVLSVDRDTLFPLQGHLGYELTQSLFIGKNTLLVEGPSDILYLQALSQALKNRSRDGLNSNWVICPTGGIDKIHSFASLFGGNKLNIAVLCDLVHGEKRKVERLKESQILKSGQVYTVADFTEKTESDIEDIFHPDLYAEILNNAYSLSGDDVLDASKLASSTPSSERIVKQTENIFKVMSADVPEFDHFTPSSWLIRNPEVLDQDTEQIALTLDVAERIFETLNSLLE